MNRQEKEDENIIVLHRTDITAPEASRIAKVMIRLFTRAEPRLITRPTSAFCSPPMTLRMNGPATERSSAPIFLEASGCPIRWPRNR